MSYNNSSDRFLASSSFECRRQPSNSLYVSRMEEMDCSNELAELFDVAQDNEWMPSNPEPLYRKSGSTKVQLHHKEECAQSFPGSTEADSEEDYFESQVEALDELSELFGDDSPRSSPPSRSVVFTRPSNPIVKDSQFCFPRCSAPAPQVVGHKENNLEVTKMDFSASLDSKRQGLNRITYTKPSVSIFRPMARVNSRPTSSLPGSF